MLFQTLALSPTLLLTNELLTIRPRQSLEAWASMLSQGSPTEPYSNMGGSIYPQRGLSLTVQQEAVVQDAP